MTVQKHYPYLTGIMGSECNSLPESRSVYLSKHYHELAHTVEEKIDQVENESSVYWHKVFQLVANFCPDVVYYPLALAFGMRELPQRGMFRSFLHKDLVLFIGKPGSHDGADTPSKSNDRLRQRLYSSPSRAAIWSQRCSFETSVSRSKQKAHSKTVN